MTTAVMPLKARRPALMTSEEFLEWLEPGVSADLIGGEIKMHSPVNLRHARLLNFMDRLLAGYVEHEDLGEVHRENVAVRLSIRDTFMPDLAYFSKQQAARLLDTHAHFPPAFIVEALSPRTAQNDTGRKFAAYELHGVQEYWILDPEQLQHRFYCRVGDMLGEIGAGMERIESASVPGFWVKRVWLNPARLPPVSKCLADILSKSQSAKRK